MEKKRRKEDFKPHSKLEIVPKAAQRPALNEKDRKILEDVQNIIWDPARLSKFKSDGNPPADGLGKKKAAK